MSADRGDWLAGRTRITGRTRLEPKDFRDKAAIVGVGYTAQQRTVPEAVDFASRQSYNPSTKVEPRRED